ncbi:MAG: energy-coupling factor ABC transporter permease [Planctomycetes bacterium]|nr:energy-coupling factor ABC transporter permease [Planctomycetota bacterium]
MSATITIAGAAATATLAVHIPYGLLPWEWAVGTAAATAACFLLGLRKVAQARRRHPEAVAFLALMTAMVFVISAIHVPLPVAVHLFGVPMAAILLGPWRATVAGCVALLFQSLFIGHGGLDALGANGLTIAVTGSFTAFIVFRGAQAMRLPDGVAAFLATFVAVGAIFLCFCAVVALARPELRAGEWTLAAFEERVGLVINAHEELEGGRGPAAHPPVVRVAMVLGPPLLVLHLLVAVGEGIVSAAFLKFLIRRRPDILTSLGVRFRASAARPPGPGNAAARVSPGGAGGGGGGPALRAVLLCAALAAGGSGDAWAHAGGHGEQGGGVRQRRPGVDEVVVARVERMTGRRLPPGLFPFLEDPATLLSMFLFAGAAGGFVIGYLWRGLFGKRAAPVAPAPPVPPTPGVKG